MAWDQTTMLNACGTACCFAGWTLIEAGWSIQRTEPYADFVRDTVVLNPIDILYEAASALGLSPNQARRLFAGDNTVKDLQRLVQEFLAVES